jgi:hypothetical protein
MVPVQRASTTSISKPATGTTANSTPAAAAAGADSMDVIRRLDDKHLNLLADRLWPSIRARLVAGLLDMISAVLPDLLRGLDRKHLDLLAHRLWPATRRRLNAELLDSRMRTGSFQDRNGRG